MAGSSDRNDPFAAFNFQVVIDGVTVAGFSEVSGLTTETDPIEYRTGAEINHVRKLPGLAKYSNITLKRGYTTSPELWSWRQKVIQGKTERQSGSIVLLNEAREPALKWKFTEGWPRKWEGPSFNAKNNEIAIETLEIVCETIELDV
ncbi:MAG: phage tail protein [Anaerolineae bacterium]|nr:phage tail protein [Anaerolineae bacterium]MCA9907464.1 phage tail protein [Anaerolineae bacterium]